MTRLLAAGFIAALALAVTATVATAGTDPRLCKGASVQWCSSNAAESALTHAIWRRVRDNNLSVKITCFSTDAHLRWVCTFHGDLISSGKAIVLLGSKPNWRPAVTFVGLTCTRAHWGCPAP